MRKMDLYLALNPLLLVSSSYDVFRGVERVPVLPSCHALLLVSLHVFLCWEQHTEIYSWGRYQDPGRTSGKQARTDPRGCVQMLRTYYPATQFGIWGHQCARLDFEDCKWESYSHEAVALGSSRSTCSYERP